MNHDDPLTPISSFLPSTPVELQNYEDSSPSIIRIISPNKKKVRQDDVIQEIRVHIGKLLKAGLYKCISVL